MLTTGQQRFVSLSQLGDGVGGAVAKLQPSSVSARILRTNLLKRFFGFGDPSPAPPAPAADDVLSATRDAAETAVAALRRKQEEERRRAEEARRKREEEERKRREEEERKRRENETAPMMVREDQPAVRYSVGPRYIDESVESTRSFLHGELETFDSRAFSRRIVQGVKDVYGGNPVPFYTAAGLSRSAYSKIMSFPNRHPSKDTVLAMSAALKMPLADAESLLRLAGYALSDSIPSDLVWRACFAGGVHYLPQIRQLLAEFAGR